jgi:hypothetical protein
LIAIRTISRYLPYEPLAYVLLIVGTMGDHLSTMIALTRPYIYETNAFTVQLIANGLWLPFDISLMIIGIVLPYLLIRRIGHPSLRGLLAYPLVLGVIRLGACIWNVSLIL